MPALCIVRCASATFLKQADGDGQMEDAFCRAGYDVEVGIRAGASAGASSSTRNGVLAVYCQRHDIDDLSLRHNVSNRMEQDSSQTWRRTSGGWPGGLRSPCAAGVMEGAAHCAFLRRLRTVGGIVGQNAGAEPCAVMRARSDMRITVLGAGSATTGAACNTGGKMPRSALIESDRDCLSG